MILSSRFLVLASVAGWFAGGPASAALLDQIVQGDASSERAHRLAAPGDLGEPTRRLRPSTPADWQGGRKTFKMKVDPARPTYFTAKFSGNEVTDKRLIFYADGRQID